MTFLGRPALWLLVQQPHRFAKCVDGFVVELHRLRTLTCGDRCVPALVAGDTLDRDDSLGGRTPAEACLVRIAGVDASLKLGQRSVAGRGFASPG